MKDKLVIIGGGGHAKSLVDVLKQLDCYHIVGYVDPVDQGPILDVTYLGTDDVLKNLIQDFGVSKAVLGVGITVTPEKRKEIVEYWTNHGLAFPPIISPTATVAAKTVFGQGSLVLHHAVVNSECVIGDFTVVNTASIVEHDCRIGDFVYIASGAVICGGVTIQGECTIGANATVIQYRNIQKGSVIGAGSVVIEDCSVSGVYVGVPAKRK